MPMQDNTFIKGGIEYDYKCMLVNNNKPNKGDVFHFNPAMIIELTIIDSIFDWFSKGYLVYNNNNETLERGPLETKKGFKFRADGYDTLLVSIKPKQADDKYLLEYKFAVYDSEDIYVTDNVGKCKKLFFWDLDYQLLLDRNFSWSSMQHEDFKDYTKTDLFKLSNNQRGITSDELLKHFIENVCAFDDRIEDKNWMACAKENKVFYTSPSQSFLIDDLETIINTCVADEENDYGPMIFKKERTQEKKKSGKFSLLSLKEYFKRSNPDQFMIENFYLQTQGAEAIMPQRSPDVKDDRNQSAILAYQYAQGAGIDNLKAYQISPQSFYSHGSGQFNWDATWNTPSVSKKYVANEMVDKLQKKGDAEKATLVTLNNWKTQDSYSVEPLLNPTNNRFGRLGAGRNKIIEAMLLLNDTLTFDVRGLTKRLSGRFVGVDMLMGIADVDFDNKLLGQWFAIGVEHKFTRTDYINTVSCVKIHTYEDMNPIKQDLDPDDLVVDEWPE